MSGDALREKAAGTYRAGESQSEFAPLAEAIFRERVLWARAMRDEDKILAGQRLFESACEITLLGIRSDSPGLSEEQCHQILRERLAMRRGWEVAA